MERIAAALERARQEREASAQVEQPALAAAHRPAARRVEPTVDAATVRLEPPHAPAPATPPHRFPTDAATLERRRVVAHLETPAADTYRMLRTRVLQRLDPQKWNCIAVVSPRTGDGKTVTAANLAISIALDPGRSALLVDLDLRRPNVHAAFGLQPDATVVDVLQGTVSVDRALYRPDGFERLVLLPGASRVTRSSELLMTTAARHLVAELRERYPNRIVILDLPPMLETDDALVAAGHVDAVLVVVAEHRTAREDVSRTLQLLAPTPVLGTVLNASRDRQASY